jgi:probable HAF family extracellular repeat protein
VFFAVAYSTPLHAQTWGAMQQVSPGFALGVNADGTVVVGRNPSHAFRWTATSGAQSLGTLGGTTSRAHSVSADGAVVVGQATNTFGQTRAFRWTAVTGLQDLGTLPSHTGAVAHDTSADGVTVVGYSRTTAGLRRAFCYDALTGMQDLGTLGGAESEALAISADGAVIVGRSTDSAGSNRAFRWTASSGMQDLGTLPGLTSAEAHDVSADGSVVVGDWSSGTFRWTATAGMQDLGIVGNTRGLSADGSVVVGQTNFAVPGAMHAYRWTAATGALNLGSLAGPFGWSAADGVSGDGSIVVGWSASASGNTAFRSSVTVPHAIGMNYCQTVPNSTGATSVLRAFGTEVLSVNSVELIAESLPLGAFGFFITSRTPAVVYPIPNSDGVLCLGGSIGRYVGPGQIRNSGTTGSFALAIDLTAIPQPLGAVPVQPGETWHFQAWHRDANPMPTSNFTNGLSLLFW